MSTCQSCKYFHAPSWRKSDPITDSQINQTLDTEDWGRCYYHPPAPNCGRTGIMQRAPVRKDEPSCSKYDES